jgi:type IX secretion system PorP/SprF family membrane protein
MLMNSIYKSLLVVMFVGLGSLVYGQQQPNYLFYQQNMSVINPAFSGSEGQFLAMNYSSSWVGVADAPRSATLVYNTAERNNASWGFSYLSDKVYVENQGIVSVDYSYKVQLSETTNLYLGLKGGALYNALDLNGLNRITNEPNAALSGIENYMNPLLGVGAYIKGEKAFFGISAPNVLNTKRYKEVNGIAVTATDRPHFYMTGGLNLAINDQIGFEPSVLYRFVNGAPNLVTAFANINFNNQVKVGTGISNNSYISGLVLFTGLERMDIGYGYEMGQRNSSVALRANSHELMIRYKLD